MDMWLVTGAACGEPRHTIPMSSTTSRPAPDEVQVWHAGVESLASDRASTSRALAWLQPDERTRFDRYRFDRDRMMFLLGRVMARSLVGQALDVAPTAWRWREGAHGRPEIDAPGTTTHFNLAHSAGLVACAVARGREVGVDVEDLAREATDAALVRRYCSPEEALDIEGRGARWRDRFLEYWTLKEAYLKARGVGISVHLSDISFSIGPEGVRVAFVRSLEGADTRWAFNLLRPTDRHLIAVAAATADGIRPTVTVRPFSLGLVASGTSLPA